MNDIVLFIIGSAVFLTLGVALGFWIGQARGEASNSRTRRLQAEFDEYKDEVTDHFSQTATHFRTLGEQYKALYEHMAGGAERLCSGNAGDRELEFPKAGMLRHGIDSEHQEQPSEQEAQAARSEDVASGDREPLTDRDGGTPSGAAPDEDTAEQPAPVSGLDEAPATVPEPPKQGQAEGERTYH